MSDKDVNQTILVGNVGKDPVIKGNAEAPVANVLVITGKNATNKTHAPKTQAHRVVVFGRLAKYIAANVKKGDRVFVLGENQTNLWTPKGSTDSIQKTEVVVNDHDGQFNLLTVR